MNLEGASKFHRYIIVSVPVYFAAAFFLANVPILRFTLAGVAWLANVYFGYKLASALGKSAALWGVLGFFGPLLIWIPHLLLLNSANKKFKENGMKIRFLGGTSKT
jgi:hypothetical protein